MRSHALQALLQLFGSVHVQLRPSAPTLVALDLTDCKHFRSFPGQHIRSCGKALRLHLGPRHHPAPKLIDCPPQSGRARPQVSAVLPRSLLQVRYGPGRRAGRR